MPLQSTALANAVKTGWLRNALLAMASTLVSLGALELVARATRWLPENAAGGVDLYEYDSLLGWRKRPDTHTRFRGPEFDVAVDTNAAGLRDPERAVHAAGTRRLLALGDSFVEGYGVRLDETVSQVLERGLNDQGCRAEVINGGTTGYSTDQEYLFYKHQGAGYSPGLVVLFFYYNDVLYNARGGHRHPVRGKPVFMVENDQLLLRNVPVPPTPPGPGRRAAPAAERPRSALVDWARERMLRGAPRGYDALARLGLWPVVEPSDPALELKVYKRKPLPALEDAWARTAVILRTLAREVEASGGRFLAVYVPSAMEVDDRVWELSKLRDGFDEEHWDRGLVARRLLDIGRAAGFGVLDLTQAMQRERGFWRGGPYYLIDGHWNALGHRVAAREVLGYLRRDNGLAGCPLPTVAPPPENAPRRNP